LTAKHHAELPSFSSSFADTIVPPLSNTKWDDFLGSNCKVLGFRIAVPPGKCESLVHRGAEYPSIHKTHGDAYV
jgi:hypothetical protein